MWRGRGEPHGLTLRALRRLTGVVIVVAGMALVLAVPAASSDVNRAAPTKHSAPRFTSVIHAAGCQERTPIAERRCVVAHAPVVAPSRHVQGSLAADPGSTPWLSYATSVNPGSAIQFVSPKAGWRVDGEYAAPWLDSELTTGAGGSTLDWPATGVSKSTDGGATWTMIWSSPHGVWGIDFLSPAVGWIVGVDSLATTDDGGATWQSLPEPDAGALVTVSFATSTTGFGLTTDGQLVKTANGGGSWQDANLGTPGTAVCYASPNVGYVSDAQGDVFRTTDGGATWSKDYSSDVPLTYAPVWSYLACDAASASEGIRVVSPLLRQEGYLVAHREGTSPTWGAVASNNPNAPATSTVASTGLDSLQGVASAQGKPLVVGLPARGFAPAIDSAGGAGPALVPVTAAPAALPASPSIDQLTTSPEAYLRVVGATTLGADSWVYLVDAAVHGTSPDYDTLVLASHDSGASWAIANDSGTLTQPQYQ